MSERLMGLFVMEELGDYYTDPLINLSLKKEKWSDIVVPDVVLHKVHHTLFMAKW